MSSPFFLCRRATGWRFSAAVAKSKQTRGDGTQWSPIRRKASNGIFFGDQQLATIPGGSQLVAIYNALFFLQLPMATVGSQLVANSDVLILIFLYIGDGLLGVGSSSPFSTGIFQILNLKWRLFFRHCIVAIFCINKQDVTLLYIVVF